MKKITLNKTSLFISYFFVFIGYYISLIISTNLIGGGKSESITIPLRLLIIFAFFIYFIKHKSYKINPAHILFLIFSVAYIGRIFIEAVSSIKNYPLSISTYLLYFLSFVAIPFYIISFTRYSTESYNFIKKTIILSSAVFCIAVFLFYQEFIGQAGRISSLVSKDDNYISPLALSYVSALGIGLILNELFQKNINIKTRIIYILVILANFIPFYLGASRGSIISLLLPILIILVTTKVDKNKLYMFILIPVFIFILVYFSISTQSAVFDRLLNLGNDIETGASSSIRVVMWNEGIELFSNNPLFGSSLNLPTFNTYPHNIIIESLLATGFIGTVPFLLFLFYCFYQALKIIRHNPQFSWISIIFIQALVQHLFSNGLYTASWLAVGSALIIGFKISYHEKN